MNNPLPKDKQLTNQEALELIGAMTLELGEYCDFLGGDIPVVDDQDRGEADDYEPHMHNDAVEGGARFPNINKRWLAIGVTNLQQGLMAFRRAAHGDNRGF